MVTRVGDRRQIPRWLLLILALQTAVIIGLIATIGTALFGGWLPAVVVGFVVLGACFSVILGAIGFLAES